MRIIDADKINFLWTPIAPIYISDDVHYESIAFKKEIDAQPTIDPIKHAHWTREKYRLMSWWKCSNCNSQERVISRYCPHCGAKMDEEAE